MDVILMYEMYQGKTRYKRLKIWDKRNGVHATYYLPLLPRLDCMSQDTVRNSLGNRILQLVLDKDKIGDYKGRKRISVY